MMIKVSEIYNKIKRAKVIVGMAMLTAIFAIIILLIQNKKSLFIKEAIDAARKRPQVVSTTKAEYQIWRSEITSIGNVKAVNGVDLSFESSGVLEKINITSGQDIDAGVIIAQLRLDQDQARLDIAKSSLELAEKTYTRDAGLLKTNSISKATLESDAANLKISKGRVAEQLAVIEQKLLRAPFPGRLGVGKVDLGQYVSAGTPIVSLQAMDPIYIDFTLPQQYLQSIKVGQECIADVDTIPKLRMVGSINSLDSKINQETRNIQIRALFVNKEKKLVPGMFANISTEIGVATQKITLPITSIVYAPYGDSVFVVENSNISSSGKIAVKRFVKLGEARGDQISILEGIKQGEEIVSTGQVKLKNDSPVKINNAIQPKNEINPMPEEDIK